MRCQIVTLDSVSRLKGHFPVLSHFRGNNYLIAVFGRENKFVSKCSWLPAESSNDLWSTAISLQGTLQTIQRGNLMVVQVLSFTSFHPLKSRALITLLSFYSIDLEYIYIYMYPLPCLQGIYGRASSVKDDS